MRRLRVALLIVVTLAGCSWQRQPTPIASADARAAFARDVEAIRRVRVGMTQAEVEALLGPPDGVEYRFTGRGVAAMFLIPVPHAWELRYRYVHRGRVVLAYGLLDPDGEVVAVEPDAGEPG